MDLPEFLKIFLADPFHGRIVRDRVVPVEEEAVVLGVVKLPESRVLCPCFRFPVFRREAYKPVTAGIPLRQIAGKLLQRTRGILPDAAGIKLDIVILGQMVIVEPALHRAVGLIKKDLVLRPGKSLPGSGDKILLRLDAVEKDGIEGPGGVQGQFVSKINVFVKIFLLQWDQHFVFFSLYIIL